MTRGALPVVESTSAATLPIVTPEGVALDFTVARAGDRMAAFLLDMVVIWCATFLIVILVAVSYGSMGGGGGLAWALVLLALFLLHGFYFIWFETRGRGMTPGKRRMGIRVMDGEGSALTGGAVIVRNVMRILEFQLPIMVLFVPQALWPEAPAWAALLASGWVLILAGMPLFNRRRLRVGDLVAGTVVVVAPKAQLLRDLGRERVESGAAVAPRFSFTTAQLDAYGAFELQVLEDVLRRKPKEAGQKKVLAAVADRIATKIKWPGAVAPSDRHPFLLEYYTALRARLEQKLLFGKRKKDKFHRDA